MMESTPACEDRPASFSVFLPVYVDTTPKMAMVDGKMELVQGGKFHVNVSDIEQFIEQHYMMQEPVSCMTCPCEQFIPDVLDFLQYDSQADVQTPEPISQADVEEAES